MLELYLEPAGLFVMVCPKPFHRHATEVIRQLLHGSSAFETCVSHVPSWLRAGLPEAEVVVHEILLVQWCREARPGSDARGR